MSFPLLLCTNGNKETRPAMDYGIWLAGLLGANVTLLGVRETPDVSGQLKKTMEETAAKLSQAGIQFEMQTKTGAAPKLIADHVCSEKFLTVIGPLGRSTFQRVVHGRSIRRVMELVCSPVLYVRENRPQMKRICLCLGGLAYSHDAETLSFYLAKTANANLTLLHIVEPVTLAYPVAKEVHDHWKHIEDTATPQGINLRRTFESARASGLEVQLKVRHGNTVHEIIEEVKSGSYDLIAMGSSYSAHSLRHIYMPNVTAEIAESLQCPVLTVRQGYALV
jgi:nucleotide-binding universal stress UspA family protein